jgi:hypothetical protein
MTVQIPSLAMWWADDSLNVAGPNACIVMLASFLLPYGLLMSCWLSFSARGRDCNVELLRARPTTQLLGAHPQRSLIVLTQHYDTAALFLS